MSNEHEALAMLRELHAEMLAKGVNGWPNTVQLAIDTFATSSHAPSDTLERREAMPDAPWFLIAIGGKVGDRFRNTVILDCSPDMKDLGPEFHWEDTFETEPPEHLPAGAYVWSGFVLGGWAEDDPIVAKGGTFTPHAALSLPAREVAEVAQRAVEHGQACLSTISRDTSHVQIERAALRTLLRFATEALATTPAPREMEAASALLPYTSHSIGCAVYQRSWASGEPPCTCGLEAARATLAKLDRSAEVR